MHETWSTLRLQLDAQQMPDVLSVLPGIIEARTGNLEDRVTKHLEYESSRRFPLIEWLACSQSSIHFC